MVPDHYDDEDDDSGEHKMTHKDRWSQRKTDISTHSGWTLLAIDQRWLGANTLTKTYLQDAGGSGDQKATFHEYDTLMH